MIKRNLLFAQSGGPTAVINASATGVIETAIKSKAFDKILCGHFGIDGIMNEDFIDVSNFTKKQLELLAITPASAFGSCRFKLPAFEEDKAPYEKILEVFEKYNVGVFAYNGGNDSMDTCNKVSKYFKKVGYDCKVIGVPKTVDNDLAETDHTPGYGSAIKYIATTLSEIALDTAVYKKGKITVCEIMGRDSGFLTCGAKLAELNGEGVDLIYLPERPFDREKFIEQVSEVYKKKQRCLIAISEGIRDKDGYVSEVGTKDSFNHTQLGGAGKYLADLITEKLGVKTRAIELNLPQRCSAVIASKTDVNEARLAGKRAVELALDGETDKMVGFKRVGNKTELVAVPLENVANAVKVVPDSFIAKDGAHITEEFVKYALPLIQGEVKHTFENGLPVYFALDKNK